MARQITTYFNYVSKLITFQPHKCCVRNRPDPLRNACVARLVTSLSTAHLLLSYSPENYVSSKILSSLLLIQDAPRLIN